MKLKYEAIFYDKKSGKDIVLANNLTKLQASKIIKSFPIEKSKVIRCRIDDTSLLPSKKMKVKTKTFTKPKKTVACSKVLQLMDKDYSYQKALKEVLKNDKRLNKAKLEIELDKYI